MSNMFDLSGRVALITGGSKGIGKAIAQGFAEAGAGIVLVSRHEDELARASAEIERTTGAKGAHIAADLSRRSEAKRVADKALEVLRAR